jgi:hypothetical protein
MKLVKNVVRTLVLTTLALVAILNSAPEKKSDLKVDANTATAITAMNEVIVQASAN